MPTPFIAASCESSIQARPSKCDADFDLAVFTWVFALATFFQLARGDMGLFPSLRNVPSGVGLGDGIVPQCWFCAALVALMWPRVWSLLLLAALGTYDFWWRLPLVTPSMFFHGLVSAQVLITALAVCCSKRNFRIGAIEFLGRFRASVLALLLVLFAFAVFHKFTWTAIQWTSGFFDLVTRYYAPFVPAAKIPAIVHWSLTVCGEAILLVALFFRRTRPLAVPLCLAFACFVGLAVYGFGSIVLASVLVLTSTKVVMAPILSTSWARLLTRHLSCSAMRIIFGVTLAGVFLIDHWSGFTLADRGWLFEAGKEPTTRDILTPMQFAWFVVSTPILVSAIVALRKSGSAIVGDIGSIRRISVCGLAAFLVVSEVGLYTGLKNRPNVAMFSGLQVVSQTPNHRIVHDRLLSSFFYQDLLLVMPPDGEARIGIPPTSLRARRDRAHRLGIEDMYVEIYQVGEISRLRGGVEAPFDFAELDDVRPYHFIEWLFPRQLFLLDPATEPDLRHSMPGLFTR